MATLWLKDKEGKEEKRYMDKKAAKAFIEKRNAEIAYLKQQLIAAKYSIESMEQKVKEMSSERKALFITILVLAVFLIIAGVMQWL